MIKQKVNNIPRVGTINGKQVLFVDGSPFVLLAGEVHNSSSSSLRYMQKIWEKAKSLHLNCLLLPVTWELTEPKEGCFDFSLVHGLIDQARQYGMKIVFLWFGAWKNAQCYYAPEWVKKDLNRFHRAEIVKGKGFIKLENFYDMPYSSLSYLCEETRQADAYAFSRLMAAIREKDQNEHTVVAIQIENETGVMGATREHSETADTLFSAPVPADFAVYMRNNAHSMTSEIREAVMNGKPAGNWSEVFGVAAEEIFSAYHIASYVNTVSMAGKKEYNLPFAVNCWLNKPGDPAGIYPSGGPISKMREVWRFCAPQIDIYAPDIYLPNFQEICDEYTRRGEALFIPECGTHQYAASRALLCVGKYHAACYSPFGIEDMGLPFHAGQIALFGGDANDPALKTPQDADIYGKIIDLLGSLMPRIVSRYGTDKLQAGSGETEQYSVFRMDAYEIQSRYLAPDGACLVLQENENAFFLIAYHAMLSFRSLDDQKPGIDFLALEEGHFEKNVWQMDRRLNGDEAVGNVYTSPTLLRVRLFAYA